MRFTASITTLPASAAPFAATTSAAAPPGTASRTTSAPASASPTAITGAPSVPSPEPVREPYTTSCPAARDDGQDHRGADRREGGRADGDAPGMRALGEDSRAAGRQHGRDDQFRDRGLGEARAQVDG